MTICPRCLCCDTDWTECESCEDGYVDRFDEDPLWYGHDLWRCGDCDGKGGWRSCLGNCANVPEAVTDEARRSLRSPHAALPRANPHPIRPRQEGE